MENQILAKLSRIEYDNNFKILFAIESGSRAWGIESIDSDWDVRFVYTRDTDWYLSLWDRKDNIEVQDGDLDIVGWDVRKALKLAFKSNPSIIEWINSPIYLDRNNTINEFQTVLENFSAKSLMFHYVSLAQRQYKAYIINKSQVRHKQYIYAIRSIVAVYWMMQNNYKVPPLRFYKLLEHTVIDLEVKDATYELLEHKRNKHERDIVERIKLLDEFICKGVVDGAIFARNAPAPKPFPTVFQNLFYRIVFN